MRISVFLTNIDSVVITDNICRFNLFLLCLTKIIIEAETSAQHSPKDIGSWHNVFMFGSVCSCLWAQSLSLVYHWLHCRSNLFFYLRYFLNNFLWKGNIFFDLSLHLGSHILQSYHISIHLIFFVQFKPMFLLFNKDILGFLRLSCWIAWCFFLYCMFTRV